MMEELSRKLEVELASIFCRALAGGVETSFLQRHFMLPKTEHLPRQARDKHRKGKVGA